MTSFYASVLDCQTISRILTEKTLISKKQQKQLKICFLVLQLVIDHSIVNLFYKSS